MHVSLAINAYLQHTSWRGLLGLGLAVLLYPKKHTACARSPPLRLCCRIPRIADRCVRAWPAPQSGIALFFPRSLILHYPPAREQTLGYARPPLGHSTRSEPLKMKRSLLSELSWIERDAVFPWLPSSVSTSLTLFLSTSFSQLTKGNQQSRAFTLFFHTFLAFCWLPSFHSD